MILSYSLVKPHFDWFSTFLMKSPSLAAHSPATRPDFWRWPPPLWLITHSLGAWEPNHWKYPSLTNRPYGSLWYCRNFGHKLRVKAQFPLKTCIKRVPISWCKPSTCIDRPETRHACGSFGHLFPRVQLLVTVVTCIIPKFPWGFHRIQASMGILIWLVILWCHQW